jgi:hypothetical protein
MHVKVPRYLLDDHFLRSIIRKAPYQWHYRVSFSFTRKHYRVSAKLHKGLPITSSQQSLESQEKEHTQYELQREISILK